MPTVRWRRPSSGDLVAGVSVALILIPQSLAYAVLAGVPPRIGLIVGAVATIAAAPLVSSPWLQTGPSAVTALLTFGSLVAIARPGSDEYVALAALLAVVVGVLRIAVAAVRAGALAYLMSQPVLLGFTSAAAVVIILSQLPVATGVEVDASGAMRILATVVLSVGSWDPQALVTALATVALVRVGRRISPLFPGVLVAVVIGIIVSRLTGFGGAVVGDIPAITLRPSLALPWSRAVDLVVPAAVIALVGFSEAVAIARTYAQQSRTRWDADREFLSQGVANLASGVFGGFPVGGSFSRSAVNRQAGARTAWSGAVTGVVVLACLPFVGLLSPLPAAVLGGLIIASVLDLARVGGVLELWRYSRLQFRIAALTGVLTIVLSPRIHIAIIVGVVLSVAQHLRREISIATPYWSDGATLHLQPTGVLYFASAHRMEDDLTALLSEHRDADRLVLHCDRLGRVDVTGALALRSMAEHARDIGLEVAVTDLTPTSRKVVERVLSGTDTTVSSVQEAAPAASPERDAARTPETGDTPRR